MSKHILGFLADQLTDSAIDEIINMVKETEADRRERGFSICYSKDDLNLIEPGSKCLGDECRVRVEDCRGKGPEVGAFHTHPEWYPAPTVGDACTTIKSQLNQIVNKVQQQGLNPRAMSAQEIEQTELDADDFWTCSVSAPLPQLNPDKVYPYICITPIKPSNNLAKLLLHLTDTYDEYYCSMLPYEKLVKPLEINTFKDAFKWRVGVIVDGD